MKIALVLSGGGARAAYQVGVLKAVAEVLPQTASNPFTIICGTSSGAINAASLASGADNFHQSVHNLAGIWQRIAPHKIHYVGYNQLIKSSLKLLGAFFHSGIARGRPLSLLDNTPLFHFLVENIRLEKLDNLIDSGHLHALNITALAYRTGESINFFQGHPSIESWDSARRIGKQANISIQHLMASSALPAIFPAVRIEQEYYGDGAIRQTAPMSSALHLGADKIFVIGVNGRGPTNTSQKFHSPSLAQIGGQLLNSAFLDAMEEDILMLERFNDFLEHLPPEAGQKMGAKPVDVLHITPSIAFDEVAANHVKNLPPSMRTFLKTIGATRSGGGSSLASYLLFDASYCNDLIQHGYDDCMLRIDEIRTFISQARN
jgi:NTE family protein